MKVCKIFTWDAAHQLILPYESKCKNIHGHTYKVEVEIEGEPDEFGIVMDFGELKRRVENVSFDHMALNTFKGDRDGIQAKGWMKPNPTAENIVFILKEKLGLQWKPRDPKISRIRVWETPTSWAEECW